MNILILGNGAREHSIAWAVKQNPKCSRLLVAPGNAGIADIADISTINIENCDEVVKLATQEKIDFVIIGPEAPLAAGVSDELKNNGFLVFGPSKAAAQLEISKSFMKDVCTTVNIPTAKYSKFNDLLSAKKYGEKGLVINILTENHGRYLGWLNYYKNKSVLADVQPGNLVNVFWKSRLIEQMGKFKIELISSVSGKIFDEKLKLQALNSMCSILEKVLPERQSYSEIFNASNAFINLLTLQDQRKNNHWIEGYVKWEIGVLSSIGFSLDLNRCAVTGSDTNLLFVSPKTGKAVSKEGAGRHAARTGALRDGCQHSQGRGG